MVDAFLLEDEVGEIIAQFGGEDSDACTCEHIAEPMLVVGDAHQPCTSGESVCTDAYPWADMPILLGEHGGCHEGGGGVSGWE